MYSIKIRSFPDGKFVKSECCDSIGDVSVVTNQEDTKKFCNKPNRAKPHSYFILQVMNNHINEYILSQRGKLINNNIQNISPQQIRIFVNLHEYLTVKMNGQNTYKFLC